MKKVVIVQYRLLHYRVRLFEQLREACAKRGIELHLVHGQASRRELAKKDEGKLDWAHKVPNKFWEVGGKDLVWQPYPAGLRDADLVVVMQENRILSNYPLLVSRLWSRRKVAYWGHGVNLQSNAPKGLREQWKRFMLKKVDWWFAYTSMTADYLKNAGYPEKRITCLDNAIDTSGFKTDLAAISDEKLTNARAALGIPHGAPVGIFCGSLYPDKRLEFLVDAADRIRSESSAFHLIVLGDGPSMAFIREAAVRRPWLHVLGMKKGADKALYFRVADFMLNPGAVGLHIVDAFCASLILVTTAVAKHGPEIAYLSQGENGMMLNDDPAEYARAVLDLIHDSCAFKRCKAVALAASAKFTLDNMVHNFSAGIELSLNLSKSDG